MLIIIIRLVRFVMEGRISLTIILICSIIFIMVIYKAEAKKKSKSVINYNSGVKVCEDADSRTMMETSNLKAVRVNETVAKLEGKFDLKQTMQDWKMIILMERKTPLGSKEVVLTHEIPNLCTEIKKRFIEDNMYATYLRAISFPECPIEPNTYEITNMIADTSELQLNAMMEGEYYFTFTFYRIDNSKSGGFLSSNKGKRIGCLTFSCIVEPSE